jgi:hypothetical protein
VTDSGSLFLGVIAASVFVMALLQLAAIVFLARYAKRLLAISEDLQREIKPLAAKVSAIADDAQRATALAAKQIERIDVVVSDLSRRIHDTTSAVQSIVTGPLRQGTFVVSALRGILTALLTTKPGPRPERDDEDDALFVG